MKSLRNRKSQLIVQSPIIIDIKSITKQVKIAKIIEDNLH